MNISNKQLVLEYILLIVVLPLSFLLPYPLFLKIGCALAALGYIFIVMKRQDMLKNQAIKRTWKSFWGQLIIRFVVISSTTFFIVRFFYPEELFVVLGLNPLFWLLILLVYAGISVPLQELIYRTYYFNRYESLFKNDLVFILVNGLIFSLAHIFFKNALVLLMTFVGGLLFALTYKKTRSTLLVSIEHAIYGYWLFIVGMGKLLGFPVVG